jgi:hypothetical protein
MQVPFGGLRAGMHGRADPKMQVPRLRSPIAHSHARRGPRRAPLGMTSTGMGLRLTPAFVRFGASSQVSKARSFDKLRGALSKKDIPKMQVPRLRLPIVHSHARRGPRRAPLGMTSAGVRVDRRDPSLCELTSCRLGADQCFGGGVLGEHLLDAAEGLAGALLVFDERKADVAIAVVAEADAGRDGNFGFCQ